MHSVAHRSTFHHASAVDRSRDEKQERGGRETLRDRDERREGGVKGGSLIV